MSYKEFNQLSSRRKFLGMTGLGALGLGLQVGCSSERKVPQKVEGLANVASTADDSKGWVPVSNRKIRVGLIGYGFCKFSAAFGFQDHPNVEVVAVSDLFPDRCAELAKVTRCKTTYPSFEELIKDKNVEAVMISTDAPSHARHAIEALRHGKHVAINVPAVFGSLEDADKLYEEVKKSGLKYMMFETSCFHEDLYAMRQIYKAGGFGKLVYSEGEYWHYSEKGLPSYKEWRHGMPPQWYPTHSNAYYIGVTDGSFTEVSCIGMQCAMDRYQKGKNKYNNPYASETALFRTNEGGMARMARSGDTPGRMGEVGRIRGERGTFYDKYEGLEKKLPNLKRPPVPPGMGLGGHGGSHTRLTDEFVTSILKDRKPLVDISIALNLTVPGIVAHQSALKGGEWLKVPQYKL